MFEVWPLHLRNWIFHLTVSVKQLCGPYTGGCFAAVTLVGIADPIPPSLRHSERARAFALFDLRQYGLEQQRLLPLATELASH